MVIWFVFSLQLLTLGISLYALRKIWRVSYQMRNQAQEIKAVIRRASVSTTRQIEYLAQLYRILDMPFGSLPPTRSWSASPDFLYVIGDSTLNEKPGCIVECGSGISTIVLARCLEKLGKGRLISIEHDYEFAQITQKNIDDLGLSSKVKIVYAPLVDMDVSGEKYHWYDLSNIKSIPETIDMLVVDGPPTGGDSQARYPAGPLLVSRLSVGGRAFFDDANRAGERAAIMKISAEMVELERKDHPAEKGCSEFHNRANV